jgi:hypothetical protein
MRPMKPLRTLDKFNHRRSRLDDYYNQAETIILTRQDPGQDCYLLVRLRPLA